MSTEAPNVFQKIAESTNHIVTPANVVSGLGFVASMHGATHLDTWRGVTETGIGFAADVVDGKVARATKTSSPLGEKVDATLDKIKTGYFAARLLLEKRAPGHLVGAVVAQNAVNAAITLYDQKHNDPPRVHPTKAGKRGMFAQNSGLGLHAIGAKLQESYPRAGKTVKLAGTAIGYTGIALSTIASVQYAQAAGILSRR